MFKMSPKIPLILRLKKTRHKEIARVQDIIVEELYNVFDKAVLHGGTSIWRCYNGNRFSEDIDVYILRDIRKINILFENLEKKGFVIEKKKIGENSLYSNLRLDGVFVRFEALFKKIKGTLKEYETVDSNFITIYTLTPEALLKEKINTYIQRKKVRDIYDVFFLLRYSELDEAIRKQLDNFIKNFKKPVDEKELNVLIFEGLVPELRDILTYIKRKI